MVLAAGKAISHKPIRSLRKYIFPIAPSRGYARAGKPGRAAVFPNDCTLNNKAIEGSISKYPNNASSILNPNAANNNGREPSRNSKL